MLRRATRSWRPIDDWLADAVVAAALRDGDDDLDAMWPLWRTSTSIITKGEDGRSYIAIDTASNHPNVTMDAGSTHYWQYHRDQAGPGRHRICLFDKRRHMLPETVVDALVGRRLRDVLDVGGDAGLVIETATQIDSDVFGLSWISMVVRMPDEPDMGTGKGKQDRGRS